VCIFAYLFYIYLYFKEVNGKHKMVTRRTVMEKTPLSEIFRGQLRTRTVKNGENEPTENIEPFFTLKLDIEVYYCETNK